MIPATLVRTSGPDPKGPAWTGIWSDPETTAEVLRIGYHYDSGGTVIDICFWRQPERYAKALNGILSELAFGEPRPIQYRMRPHGREWFCYLPYRMRGAYQFLDDARTAEWLRVTL